LVVAGCDVALEAAQMLKAIAKPQIQIGPEDHGRRMALDDFDRAIARAGFRYELHEGVIDVSDIPPPDHALQVQELRDQLTAYRLAHPGRIVLLAGAGEAKILIESDESERHPDLSVYLTAAPQVADLWSLWVPEIVIEVVSKRSAARDYDEKPGEYLSFGVDECWIIDRYKQQMTVLTRWRGQWKTQILKPARKYASRHLPGFALDLKRVFAAAGAVEK
jgi:Uma2 family endonuclease